MKTYQVIFRLIQEYGLFQQVDLSTLYTFVKYLQDENWNKNAPDSFKRYKLLLDKSNEATKRLRQQLTNVHNSAQWPKDISINSEEIKVALQNTEHIEPVNDITGTRLPPNRFTYMNPIQTRE